MPPPKASYNLSVRDLVEFALRAGDLGGEREFVGANRALAGIRGHQKIQRSRPTGYEIEIPVEYLLEAESFTLKIRGRIDGLLPSAESVLLEEIKTLQGVWKGTADPLHWAQAKIYGYIYARKRALEKLDLQLTYLELASGRIIELPQSSTFDELSDFFASTTAIYSDWLQAEHQWRYERDQSIGTLAFPYPQYRTGQRESAVAVYRTLSDGERLFLAAPTGIGKTISTLFPAIKALGAGKIQRIFYLTARTIGRTVAEKALADLRRTGLKIRAVTITAKEKVCIRDGHPCDVLTCPLAVGYYDRIKPALREVLERQEMNRATLEEVALKHQVCPYELSLDASVWADVIICDYNYVFDPQVYLRRHFDEENNQYGFLIDEAHNLVDRAREMFSADLNAAEIVHVQKQLKSNLPRLGKILAKLSSEIRKLKSPGSDSAESTLLASDPAFELNLFPVNTAANKIDASEVALSQLPAALCEWVESALAHADDWLAQNDPAEFREDLLALYFRLNAFARTAERYDARYATIIGNSPSPNVKLFCVDPSKLLREALDRGQAAVFFSATLTPVEYYRTLLGGDLDDPVLQLASPFSPDNLAVLIQDHIQTNFKSRTESAADVAAWIGSFVQGRRGNYLIYFPSYQYLDMVLREFQSRFPSLSVLVQKPGMNDAERDAFLAAFSVDHIQTLAGFAVMGGIFGEGIDLIGEDLIGVVVVGVGLPQICTERDLIRDFFQQQRSSGFDYAYTFPGMNRVLQAVGRVIRTETDRGAVLLIDARFKNSIYRRLFPPWWKFHRTRTIEGLKNALNDFWES